MNDEELFHLIDATLPEDLTEDQVSLLRSRIRACPELAETLMFELKFEQNLAIQLAPEPRNFSNILEQLALQDQEQSDQKSNKLGAYFLMILVMLVIVSGFIAFIVYFPKQENPGQDPSRHLAKNPDPPTTQPGMAAVDLENIEAVNPEPDTEANPDNPGPINDPHNDLENKIKIPVPVLPDWAMHEIPEHTFKSTLRRPAFDELMQSMKAKIQDRNGVLTLSGSFRMKSLPVEGQVLRFALNRGRSLSYDFYHQRDGIRIELGSDRTVNVYEITRNKSADRDPNTQHFITRRTEVWKRRNASGLGIQHWEGNIILRHGDDVLLRVRMPDQPDDLILKAEGTLGYVSLERLKNPPPVDTVDPEVIPFTATSGPMKLIQTEWMGEHLPTLTESAITQQLSADKTKSSSTLNFPAKPGTELILFLDRFEPGTRLKAVQGRTNVSLESVKRDNQFWIVQSEHRDSFERAKRSGYSYKNNLKLRYRWNLDSMEISMSADGGSYQLLRTERLDQLTEQLRFEINTRNAKDTQFSIQQLVVTELSPWDRLASSEYREEAEALLGKDSKLTLEDRVKSWQQNKKPKKASGREWRKALLCAIMMNSPYHVDRRKAFTWLIEDQVKDGPLNESLLELLEMIPGWMAMNQSQTLSWGMMRDFFNHLARRSINLDQKSYLPRLWDSWKKLGQDSTQMSTWRDQEGTVPVQLMRELLYHYYHHQDYTQLRLTALEVFQWQRDYDLRFSGTDQERRLLQLCDWFIAYSDDRLDDRPHAKRRQILDDWIHPIDIHIARDAMVMLDDLRAAMNTGNVSLAARILTSRSLPQGIAPYDQDSLLYQSIQNSSLAIVRKHRELQQEIRENYADLGELRYRQALLRNDDKALQSLTIQFYGTPASIHVLRELANRSLSSGQFHLAQSYYARIQEQSVSSFTTSDQAKMRLSAAMLGKNIGGPITENVILNGQSFSASRFENMIKRLLESRSQGNVTFSKPDFKFAPGSDHQVQSLQQWLELRTGRSAANKQLQYLTSMQEHEDRQVWTLPGNLAWMKASDASGLAQHQPKYKNRRRLYLAQEPVIRNDVMYYRVPNHYRYSMQAYDLNKRKTLWSNTGNNDWISDPIGVGTWLYAISASNEYGLGKQISLRQISPNNGEIIATYPLLQLNWSDRTELPAILKLHGDQLICMMPGTIVVMTLQGEIRWVRKLEMVPQNVDAALWDQQIPGFMVQGDYLLVKTLGMSEILCLRLGSGELVWKTAILNFQEMIGSTPKSWIFSTKSQLFSVDLKNGDIQNYWDHLPGQDIHLMSGSQQEAQILTIRFKNLASNQKHEMKTQEEARQLIWRSPETKEPKQVQSFPMDDLKNPSRVWTDGQHLYLMMNADNRNGRAWIYRMPFKKP